MMHWSTILVSLVLSQCGADALRQHLRHASRVHAKVRALQREESCSEIGCGEFQWGAPCQCNDLCEQYGNCCDDYAELCEGWAPSPTPPLPGDSAYCSGGTDSTLCPREGDNVLGAGAGGTCTFRYTYHTGTGQETGAAVVTSGSCIVTSADLGAGSGTNQRVRDWVRSLAAHDGFEQDDAGHILANNLGGCGTCPINLFPQNLGINRGVYRVMEGAIADCISEGVTAELSWVFQYKSPSVEHLRPDSYTYNATFQGGNCGSMSQTFENPQWYPSALIDNLPKQVSD